MSSHANADEIVYHEPPFRQVPDAVILHPDLADVDVRLFCVLAWCARGGHGAFPGRRRLAELLHKKSERTVDAALARLRAAGFLTVQPRYNERGARISNLYILHHTPLPEDQRQTTLVNDAGANQGNPPAIDCEGGGVGAPPSNELQGGVAAGCEGPSQQVAGIRDTKIKGHEGEDPSLLAVGEVQDRKAAAPAGLRPGSEEASHTPSAAAEPSTGRPPSALELVWLAFPEELRRRIGHQGSTAVAEAIREQLAHRTPEQLAEQVRRRWQAWRARGERIRHPVKLALMLLERAEPAAGRRRRSPHDRTVAEALARPVDPGDDPSPRPAPPAPGTSEAARRALADMRACLDQVNQRRRQPAATGATARCA